jgi:hypothetical protein
MHRLYLLALLLSVLSFDSLLPSWRLDRDILFNSRLAAASDNSGQNLHPWLHHNPKLCFKKHVQNSRPRRNHQGNELILTLLHRPNLPCPLKQQVCLPVERKRKMAEGRVDSSLMGVPLALARVVEGLDTPVIGRGKGVGGRELAALWFSYMQFNWPRNVCV